MALGRIETRRRRKVGYTDRNGGRQMGVIQERTPSTTTRLLCGAALPASAEPRSSTGESFLQRGPGKRTAILTERWAGRIQSHNVPLPLRSNKPPPPPDTTCRFPSRIRILGTSVPYPSCMPVCRREWGKAVAETSVSSLEGYSSVGQGASLPLGDGKRPRGGGGGGLSSCGHRSAKAGPDGLTLFMPWVCVDCASAF